MLGLCDLFGGTCQPYYAAICHKR